MTAKDSSDREMAERRVGLRWSVHRWLTLLVSRMFESAVQPAVNGVQIDRFTMIGTEFNDERRRYCTRCSFLRDSSSVSGDNEKLSC